MSRVATARPGQAQARRGSWILVVAGCVALLLRIRLSALPPDARAVSFLLLTGGILASALLVPIAGRADHAHVAPATGLAVGLAAVGLATAVSGPVIHAPFSRWAIPLTVIAAVAEEVLFRRVAYGWLLRWGAPVAVIGSALAFAVLHVPLYGIAVLPVDLGAGLLLSWQRWATGTWTVPAATHAAANVIATVLR